MISSDGQGLSYLCERWCPRTHRASLCSRVRVCMRAPTRGRAGAGTARARVGWGHPPPGAPPPTEACARPYFSTIFWMVVFPAGLSRCYCVAFGLSGSCLVQLAVSRAGRLLWCWGVVGHPTSYAGRRVLSSARPVAWDRAPFPATCPLRWLTRLGAGAGLAPAGGAGVVVLCLAGVSWGVAGLRVGHGGCCRWLAAGVSSSGAWRLPGRLP